MKKKEDILIGQRIKDIRSNLNMDQKTFANKLKATVSALSNWENGRNKPNDIMLRRIAELGNVSVAYLLEGKYMLRDIHMIHDEQRGNFLDEFGKPIITDDFANKRFNQAMKRFSESVDNKYIKTDMATLIDALIDIKENKIPDKYLESEIESISSELAKIPLKMAKLYN